MGNDRAFHYYALFLVAGVASVITASVMAGLATLPTPLVFAEHLALSLLFRASYKSFGGFDWITGGDELVEIPTAAAPSEGGVADATA